MNDFRGTTVETVAEQVRQGEVTARRQVEIALGAIEAYNSTIHAFTVVDADAALTAADDIDRRVAAGEDVGPLAGVPIGVKDLEDAIGFTTTNGSALHVNDPAATTDSHMVARLRAAGCVIVGKTNSPEFGWQADTRNTIYPDTVNPWDPTRSAGGSSGGSGAAIAAGMVPLATGSDGGGSIRIPSAVNGLSGLKPSLGRVPIGGAKPPSWLHLSTPGPMARTIRDVALALDVVVGPEATDMHSLPPHHSSETWLGALTDLMLPRKVLWSADLGYGAVDPEVLAACRGAVDALADRGVEVVETSVFDEDPVMSWASISYGGLDRSLGELKGTPEWDKIDEGLRRMIGLVEGMSGRDVLRAYDAGHRLNHRLVELFHQAPILLCPTTAGQTGLVGHQGLIDGEENFGWVSNTYPFNMTGNPAGTVCAGFASTGMPIGLQVIGPRHADAVVLRAIGAIEGVLALDTVAPLDWA